MPKLNTDPDIDSLLETPELKTGEYGLWLRVFIISVFEIRSGRWNTAAKDFLFDPENEFFDYVSDCLGYDPEAMRARIKRLL